MPQGRHPWHAAGEGGGVLQLLAQDRAGVVRVGPLPELDEAVAAFEIEVLERGVGVGHAEGQLGRAAFAGAALDGVEEGLTDAAALEVGVDGELGEAVDVGLLEPRRPLVGLFFVEEDDADDALAAWMGGVLEGGDVALAGVAAARGGGVVLAAGEGREAHRDLRGVGAVEELGDLGDGVAVAQAADDGGIAGGCGGWRRDWCRDGRGHAHGASRRDGAGLGWRRRGGHEEQLYTVSCEQSRQKQSVYERGRRRNDARDHDRGNAKLSCAELAHAEPGRDAGAGEVLRV